MAEIEFHVRSFLSQDQSAVRRLLPEGMREHFGFIDETLNPDLRDITSSYLAAGHLFLVAEEALAIIGTAALLIQPDGVGQPVRVLTAQAYRHAGIAHRLCRTLLELARQRELVRLLVETNHDWLPAINLYLHVGFSEYLRTSQQVLFSLDLKPQEAI